MLRTRGSDNRGDWTEGANRKRNTEKTLSASILGCNPICTVYTADIGIRKMNTAAGDALGGCRLRQRARRRTVMQAANPRLRQMQLIHRYSPRPCYNLPRIVMSI